jgi:hypothetical protein
MRTRESNYLSAENDLNIYQLSFQSEMTVIRIFNDLTAKISPLIQRRSWSQDGRQDVQPTRNLSSIS